MNGTQEHVADASSDTVSAAAVAAAAAAASVAAPAPVAAPVAVPTDSLTAVQKDPDALKLFIGQLPKAMSEAEVKDIFAPFGPIAEFMILKDKFTGTSKGCGFVTFAKRESAKEAMSALHEQMTLPGMQNQLQVKLADSETRDDQRKLFVGMLPKASTEEYLKQLFTPYGEVEDIYIMKHPDGQGKGCAFVKFAAASSATAAIAAMHQRMTLEGCTSPMIVKFAETEREKNAKRMGQQLMQPQHQMPLMGRPGMAGGFNMNYGMGMGYGAGMGGYAPQGYMGANPQQLQAAGGTATGVAAGAWTDPAQYTGAASAAPMHPYAPTAAYQGAPVTPYNAQQLAGAQQQQQKTAAASGGPDGCNLFIYHVPAEFNDNDLAATFAPFGNVISSKIFIDKMTGQSKCFGFVSYDNNTSAANAIQAMNGFQIGQKRLKVQLKRPRDQGRPY